MGFLAVVTTAVALAAPVKTVASYCSPSGDVCYGVFTRGKVVLLRISTAAHYFPRYTLCVRPPAGAQRCGSFPVFRGVASTWGSSVRHGRQFPAPGAGVYRVTWKLGSGPLGPTLRFRLPVR